jgi:ssDNA-binding Zn-finger/Zn-ribbon topoisomerase 1
MESQTIARAASGLQPCPKCGAVMLTRQGSRGPFAGCSNYPSCTGTRSIAATEAAVAALPTAKSEVPGPAGALVTDLRSASGYIGKAIDILRRRQAEIDELMDVRDDVHF